MFCPRNIGSRSKKDHAPRYLIVFTPQEHSDVCYAQRHQVGSAELRQREPLRAGPLPPAWQCHQRPSSSHQDHVGK